MKYCLSFYVGMKYEHSIDELRINYMRDAEALERFIQEHKNQTIIFYVREDLMSGNGGFSEEDVKIIAALMSKYSDFNCKLEFEFNDRAIKQYSVWAKELNVPFFIRKYCNRWDMLRSILNLGVSDVYITEELGFSLVDIGKIAHSNNVKVRVYPNAAQEGGFNTPDSKKFFIRPEDIDTYEDCIDVCEFYESLDKAEVLYEIYHNMKKWDSFLNFLLSNFQEYIPNAKISKEFAKVRMNCHKACNKNNLCNFCQAQLELSKIKMKIVTQGDSLWQ